MSDRIVKLLDELVAVTKNTAGRGCWHPAADVYRTASGWLVKFDLAGVSPTEIRVSRRGRHLIIAGSRRDALVQQGLSSYSLEINYNRFEREVELPADVEGADLSTEYRDGMLLVRLDCAEG